MQTHTRFRRVLYNSVCALASLAIASYALLPVTAATADGVGYRGGQIVCPSGGCHDEDSHCGGDASCQSSASTACFQGNSDKNGERCGGDTTLCTSQGCSGDDAVCGGL